MFEDFGKLLNIQEALRSRSSLSWHKGQAHSVTALLVCRQW